MNTSKTKKNQQKLVKPQSLIQSMLDKFIKVLARTKPKKLIHKTIIFKNKKKREISKIQALCRLDDANLVILVK